MLVIAHPGKPLGNHYSGWFFRGGSVRGFQVLDPGHRAFQVNFRLLQSEFYFSDRVYLRYHFLAACEKVNRHNVLRVIEVGEQLPFHH